MNVAYIIAKKYDAIITQMLAKKEHLGSVCTKET